MATKQPSCYNYTLPSPDVVTITPAGYPSFVPSSLYCRYSVSAPKDNVVVAHLNDLDLEPHSPGISFSFMGSHDPFVLVRS